MSVDKTLTVFDILEERSFNLAELCPALNESMLLAMQARWFGRGLLTSAGWLVAFAACSGRSTRNEVGSAGAPGGAPETGGHTTGGSSGAGAELNTGGSAGAAGARGGSGGEGGEPMCTYAGIGSFCVLGVGLDSGDQLVVEGRPLRLLLRPSGCHSSSCTTVVSSWCSYLASEGEITVTPLVCLREEGEACTDKCGGGASECDVGVTLSVGTTKVSIAGTNLEVTFDVPSVTEPGELCSDYLKL